MKKTNHKRVIDKNDEKYNEGNKLNKQATKKLFIHLMFVDLMMFY